MGDALPHEPWPEHPSRRRGSGPSERHRRQCHQALHQGSIVAPSQAVGSSIDTDVLVLAFAISVIGGLGSIVGSAVGALIVGMVISFGLVIPATNPFALAFVFIIMTAVLIVRPRGFFGLPDS
ncbi:MAG: hypothetical protein E6I12_00590 [Chloroflexi bacterium]|nr:MAG: hypothetical protein E6I12_00590 [Chloroflexota bacterium]